MWGIEVGELVEILYRLLLIIKILIWEFYMSKKRTYESTIYNIFFKQLKYERF